LTGSGAAPSALFRFSFFISRKLRHNVRNLHLPIHVTSRSLHTLLHTLIDYAGLFPPAGLSMDRALGLYGKYHEATHAWMLGRFVVPVARLDELLRSMELIGAPRERAWHLSALVGDGIAADVAAVLSFNQAKHQAAVDALEIKATDADRIAEIARIVPPAIKTYVEIPIDNDPHPLVEALAAARLRAKVRTGGVVPEAIPSVEHVARFLRACYTSSVAFKATAGLHHPVRAEQALTYEPDSPRAEMHGFLNVFLAAVFHYNGLTIRDTVDLLEARSLDDVVMDDEKMAWREYVVTVPELTTIRRRHAIAFGSCSFTDPVDDLIKLNLLEK
jgi:hypothetical protein